MKFLSRIFPPRAAVFCILAALAAPAPALAGETAYLMYLKGSEGLPAVPMRVVWDDARDRVTIDLGAKYEPALTKLGLPHVLEYEAPPEKSRFAVRDPEFTRFVKVVATSIVQGFGRLGATRPGQRPYGDSPHHPRGRPAGGNRAAPRHLSRSAKVRPTEGSGFDQGRHYFRRPAGTDVCGANARRQALS